ncbi:MFS transporter [Chloroflexota bacterium]
MPLFVLAHFSHHLIAALLQPLSPFIRDDFALDYTQMGWVVSAFTLAYGISQLPAGWLADRIDARTLITIGISGVAVCGLLVGLSPTYTMMVVCLVLMGVLGGGYHPAASPLVSASVVEENQGRALGLHQIGGNASYFLTPLIAIGIAATLGGWRSSFITLAIPTIIFGIVLYALLGRRRYTRQPEHRIPNSHTETPSTPSYLRKLVPFIILGIVIQVSVYSAITFIPLFVVDHLKAGEEAGAALLSLFHSSGLWASPLGGYLSDRIGKVPVMLTVCLIAGPFIYLLSLVSFGWSIFLVLLVMGTCMHIAMPVVEAYIISHTSERNRSTTLGIYYSVSRGGSGLIMPVLGYLIDQFGFGAGFTILGAASLAVALGCSMFLWGSRD